MDAFAKNIASRSFAIIKTEQSADNSEITLFIFLTPLDNFAYNVEVNIGKSK